MTAPAPRYIIGIDLGTTNSAIAFVDLKQESPDVQIFKVPQFTAAATIEARDTLPSCCYELTAGDMSAAAVTAPWHTGKKTRFIVGAWAADLGAESPSRLVTSAKSWLCHPGIDRNSPILPWRATEDVEKISPVQASARYLDHLRKTWNHAHPDNLLEQQRVIVTIPASFDEMARELTLSAARTAGMENVLLIEEPVAAFYSWNRKHGQRPDATPAAGSIILICDIGGGTTDLTLIHVRTGANGDPEYHRVAVGEHLILGGDNLDLTLAHHVEKKLAATSPLPPHLWMGLVRRCQRAKELLLGDNPPESYTIHLPGSGRSLFKNSIQIELTRAEVLSVLVDGFLPQVPHTARPATGKSGFREFGLPYAPDPAITRYVAEFLGTAADAGTLPTAKTISGFVRPDFVLLNGGFFASPTLRTRWLDVLQSWYPNGAGVQILENDRLDLAVADGAAWYGLARQLGRSIIHTGASRSYYIGISSQDRSAPSAVCLIPAGLPEGQSVQIPDRRFELLIHQPAEFPIYSSAYRAHDKPGDLVSTAESFHFTELPPLRTTLKARTKRAKGGHVQVNLNARLSEVGTIELWCSELNGARTWRLQFESRKQIQAPAPAPAPDATPDAAAAPGTDYMACMPQIEELLQATFAPVGKVRHPPALMKEIEKMVKMPREEWPLPLLRGIWDKLHDYNEGRWLSDEHHSRWLNIAGYCLRPGYGATLDDWRMQESFSIIKEDDLARADKQETRVDWFLYWRRTSGGLPTDKQDALAKFVIEFIEMFPPNHPESPLGDGEYQQMWRMLGSLEWLDPSRKIALGEQALATIREQGIACYGGGMLFALSRFGARVPAYGPMNTVIPAETVEPWIEELLRMGGTDRQFCVALMQLARKTDDRFRDISAECRDGVVKALKAANAATHVIQVVTEAVELAEEQNYVFGEQLPIGLRLA